MCTNVLKQGINLDEADMLINFDLPYNPSDLMQREDRIHRATSTHKKIIITFLSGDIEYRIYNILKAKTKLFNEIVNMSEIKGSVIKEWRGLG